MNNSSGRSSCVVYTVYSSLERAQLLHVVNALVTLFLTIPAVPLNVFVIIQYFNLPLVEKRRNSNFLIFTQTLADLFNLLIASPLHAVSHVIYLTNVFPEISDKREDSCPYVYLITGWSLAVSINSSLLIFILVALDRFMAVWKPVYWYTNLRCGHRSQLKLAVIAIWVAAGVFSLGDVYGHAVEFFSEDGSEIHVNGFHQARAVVCVLLTSVIFFMWTITFCKTCYIFRHPLVLSKAHRVIANTEKLGK